MVLTTLSTIINDPSPLVLTSSGDGGLSDKPDIMLGQFDSLGIKLQVRKAVPTDDLLQVFEEKNLLRMIQ